MKSDFRLVLRKTRSHVPQLLGLTLLVALGVCFFITLFTITTRYEEAAEEYFADHAYADVTFYGAFNEESVRLLSEMDGVRLAEGRTVHDYRDGERIFRAISLTDGIQLPYLYEGRLPENEAECVLLRRNASAMGLSTGDTILLQDREVVITGLAASPEYIYMVQNERTLMARTDHFGVVYTAKGFDPGGFNEIVALTGSALSVEAASQKIGALRAVLREDQPNHALYRSDLEEISSFAYIFPTIFAVLIAAVIFVMLTRVVQKDRKQIGVMKALGAADQRIIGVYLSQFCLTAFMGALMGCFLAMLVSGGIIGIFASMFEVPQLRFAFYPGLWAGAILFSVLLCALSGLTRLLSILPLLPAQAMRPRIPRGGRRIILERAGFLWKRASFNTRYALKNSFRNKGRFLAVVLGMCGSCALIAFSLGFYDSIGTTQEKYFNGYANYSVIVSFDPMPLFLEHPAIAAMEESRRVLMLPAHIQGESQMLAVTEPEFDMVRIPTEALSKGVIIPEYFAEQWGVGVGDTLTLSGVSADISAVVPQYLGLTFYTGFDYLNTLTDEIPAVYNTVYGRSGDMPSLSAWLKENQIDFTTIDDDKTSFHSIMESMSVLIWFMIFCAVALGFTVLYSIGLITLSAREYEYMFMGVMGYPHRSILTAHIKETVMQLALAIPLGFLSGNLLLQGIKGEFSGANFVIAAAIHPGSYLASALSVTAVTALMAWVTSRHIAGLDIVEGLKAQDE